MGQQGFGNLRAHRHDRVKRGHRLLEDHRNGAPAQGAHALCVERQQILTVELDAAFDLRRAGLQQAQNRKRGHGFARAGLAHQAERLAGGDVERKRLHGGRGSAGKAHRKLPQRQEWGAGERLRRGRNRGSGGHLRSV